MRSRSQTRTRDVLLGVIIALGVMGVLVVINWNNKSVVMKKPSTMENTAGDDFHEHTSALNTPVKQIMEDEPDPQRNKPSTLNEAGSQNVIKKAYSHVKTIVFFIGYPRSRHSLLGSLLDAHPNMVVSDESTAFVRWISNLDEWISGSIYTYYDTMPKASQRSVAKGRRSSTFEGSVAKATSQFKYYVPYQWQGNYHQYIEVIGDKAGGLTALAMKKAGAVDSVHLLEKTSGAKVKFIHVVRNPFDNIATMVLRLRKVNERYGEHNQKVNAPEGLDRQIKLYFNMAEGSNRARESLPGSVIDIPSMEVVKNPVQTLTKICKFLEITCSEKYLQDCAATVDPVPSITRDFIEWTAEQKNTVYEEMKKYSFFESYSFDK